MAPRGGQRHHPIETWQHHRKIRRAHDLDRLISGLFETPPEHSSRQPGVDERSPTDWMPRGVAADEPQRHVGAGRRRRNRDLTRDAGPHAVQYRIARDASLRLRRQEKRFTVAVEVSEPEDLRQRHIARPARAARSPRPHRDDGRNHDDGARQGADRPGPAPGHDAGRALRRGRCRHARLERVDQLPGVRVPAFTGLVERSLDHARDVVGHTRDARERRLRPIDNRLQELVVVRARERPTPGEHFVEHDAERPHVAPLVGIAATNMFRRHVGDGAEGGARPRQIADARDLRDAEVEQLGLALGRHHDVARLHIAVDDAGLMRAGQPARDLQGDADRLGRRQRATLEALLERLAVAIGHREKHPAVGRFLDVVNRADVDVIDRRGRARFLKEASLRVGVAHELRREELERHEAAKPEVLGLVDHTHPAGADLGDDAIVRDGLADHQGFTR